MKLMIDIPEKLALDGFERHFTEEEKNVLVKAIGNGTHLTSDALADLLMEERIKGELKQDISYSKDIIPDVKCILTVYIKDRRPCYCGAELREVWREKGGE